MKMKCIKCYYEFEEEWEFKTYKEFTEGLNKLIKMKNDCGDLKE